MCNNIYYTSISGQLPKPMTRFPKTTLFEIKKKNKTIQTEYSLVVSKLSIVIFCSYHIDII